jgi:cell division protein FtsB
MPLLSILSYWKEFAIGILVILVLYIGYHYHTLQDKAAENTQLKAQIEQVNKDLAATRQLEQKYLNTVKSLQVSGGKAEENARIYTGKAKDYSTCRNTPVMFRLLKSNSKE